MLRKNLNVDQKIGGRLCRVRKRGCSSSSSSSLVHNYKLKRAFLVGKRVGSGTPVPVWKIKDSKSPSLENDKVFKEVAAAKGCKLSVSARKLAAALWEMNELPSPKLKRENSEDRVSEVGRKQRTLESSRFISMPIPVSDPSHSPGFKMKEFCKVGRHHSRIAEDSQKLLQLDCNFGGANSPRSYLVESSTAKSNTWANWDKFVSPKQSRTRSPSNKYISGPGNHLRGLYNGLATSRELLRLLNRVWRHSEDHNSSSVSLFLALKFELDRSYIHFNKFILEQRSDVDILLKQLVEEKMVWKITGKDNIHNIITCESKELEVEKKLRKQTERLNKKIGNDLAETKVSLSRAARELESEKRARRILEQVCEELARGLGEDKAEVEELKRQSAKVRQEVEKEREMLQLADVLREERVKMKLSEARYQFEEKNAVVEKLRNELEAFLNSKNGKENEDESCSRYKKIKALENCLREKLQGSYIFQENETKEVKTLNQWNEDDGDSDDSDLHSIELSVDDINKCCLLNEVLGNETENKSAEKVNNIEFNTNKQERLDMFESSSQSRKNEMEDEIERYNMIKDLRDNIVSGSRMSSQNLNQPRADSLEDE